MNKLRFTTLIRIFIFILNFTYIEAAFCCGKNLLFENQYSKNQTLTQVKNRVEEWMTMGIHPEEILVVFDLDGTLTQNTNSNHHTLSAREKVDEWMPDWLERGVKVIVSSSWDRFGETLIKLRKIRISDALELKGQYTVKRGVFEIYDAHSKSKSKLTYRTAGKVASIQDSEVDPIFFRQKALAIKLLLTKREQAQIKVLISVDDSPEDLQIFRKDLARFNLYPKNLRALEFFELSQAQNGENSLEE